VQAIHRLIPDKDCGCFENLRHFIVHRSSFIVPQCERSMTTATLTEWLRADPPGHTSLPSLVVRLTSDGFVCETPESFTADEAAALAVWVRAPMKQSGAEGPLGDADDDIQDNR
jgi:hypothetical protein